MKAKLSILSAALTLGVFATGAQAAFQSCVNGPSDPGTDYNILSKVSTATNCQILLPLNGNQNDSPPPPPGMVNSLSPGFFGINNWLFDGKWDNLGGTGGTDTSVLFNFTGNNQSGTYTYVGTGTFTEIMFVFKDGSDTNLVGYLLDLNNLSGNYDSPFVEPPFPLSPAQGPKNISHISVYFRGSSTSSTSGGGEVPEPGMLGLLGLGLLGLALARRRT